MTLSKGDLLYNQASYFLSSKFQITSFAKSYLVKKTSSFE
ncbi:hypothetical protein HMPREF1557_02130 [Streptococcus sobrinus W1703]|uniref:Uncharacterized protein n=1 Tax=Streptococcus sobrinus W1703 TaxID=1227275 RepID=U2KG61_9STRE|nr:hypothetical protein HMPREF1557_02130 [Streptococcus sobrinus W1703]